MPNTKLDHQNASVTGWASQIAVLFNAERSHWTTSLTVEDKATGLVQETGHLKKRKKRKKKERKKENRRWRPWPTFVFRGPVGLTSCETSIKSSSNLGFRLNLRFLEIGLLTTDNIHIGVLAAVLVLAFTEEQIQVHIHIHENNNNNKSILAKWTRATPISTCRFQIYKEAVLQRGGV